ncbi:putative acyl-CoA synthetase [Neocallimastix lanati (nom. inval.)]|nr:putative acyl-CoA synthetase [Neocallimastix sp. JGI-2020a]
MEPTIQSGGFVMFPLNPTYTKDQLDRLCQKAKPSLIVTVFPLLQNIRDFNTDIKVLVVDSPVDDTENHNYSFEVLRNTEPDLEFLNDIRSQIQSDDLMYYACTSGSTGDPKICTYTNQQFTGNNAGAIDVSSILPNDQRRTLLFVPYFTTTGHIILGTLFLEGLFHVITDKFDPEKIFKLIEKEKVTSISGAPSAFLALMHHPSRPNYDLSSFMEINVGGAAASNEFLEKVMQTFHLKFSSSAFGMTEGCGVIYRMPAKSTSIKAGPLHRFEARVVNRETREIVNVGIPGELEFRSKVMMKEYLNNEEANKEAFTEDRWFKTGDEAVMDKDGFLTITGRIKEMILRGGHNIWPNEIVDVINEHPKIQESAVIGIPDKFQGESVVAFVIIKPGCHFDDLEKELRNFLKDKLVPFSIPTYYFDLPELPRNSSRKVYAPKLREMVQGLIQERFKKLEENNHDKPTTEPGQELAELWSKWFDIPVNAISRSSNFFALGGDSLVGVQTTGLVKKYYEDIPFNFLNIYQTLGQIEDFLIDPEGSVKVDIQLNKDFYEVKSKPAELIFGEINTVKNKQRKSVAVTGATGYLGVYVVNELNKHPEIEKIYCIGRSANSGELKLKMLAMMKKVNLELNDKIVFVIGDVTKKDCGIEPAMLETIKKECKAIIHCAAVVNWNKTYGQLKDANVTGVINAMKVAGKVMNFVYVSSFGAAIKKNETLNDKMPKKSFGYIQTKWLSEHFARKGKEIGICSTIIRPCYIIADTKTGICNTDDFIYKFIRQCVLNKIAPSDVLLDLTPVDKVAKGIVDNMMAYNKIINLIPAKQTSTDTLFKIYNEKFNGDVQMLEKEKWLEKFVTMIKDNQEALSIVPSLVVIHKNYEFTTDYLNGKNDFLNFEEENIITNFKKLEESGFFTAEGAHNLFGRTK